MTLSLSQQHRVKRIVLTRPAVEAGERLGFLPSDLTEKGNPYFRPLYDALHDMIPQLRSPPCWKPLLIEVAPLAFMQGRILNDAFVILDEAQNTTPEQMKIFLTRMGLNTRMVVTGNITQIDLPALPGNICPRSGLIQALNILHNVSALAAHRFTEGDIYTPSSCRRHCNRL